MKYISTVLLSLATFFLTVSTHAQYILNGSATQNSCNCYTLTQAQNFLSGSVWNTTKINLNNPFDFVFNVFLGCKDADGADGIVFILQPISTSVGTAGGGMGFQGIVPSVGIALDTWQNTEFNDPPYDHLSIQINGDINHAHDIVPLMQASPTNPNIEDCQWHTFRIIWDPVPKLLKTYFDGYFIQQANIDLITTVFNNDPLVYWGFSAATGGSNNLQQFCTALNPNFNATTVGNSICDGNALTFTNTSQSFAPISNFFWDFGDGTTSTSANPPPHTYPAPGSYEIKLAITGLDGCLSDTLRKSFIIGDYPVAGFTVYDTCAGQPPRISDQSHVNFGTINEWNWILDGSPVSVSQYPSLTGLTPGSHNLQLNVKTNLGCSSSFPVSNSFTIMAAPIVSIQAANGCYNEPISFSGMQLDNSTTIQQWEWEIGDNTTSSLQNFTHVFSISGSIPVHLTAISSQGCTSRDTSKNILIDDLFVDAGRDTIVLQNVPFHLGASYASGGSSGGFPSLVWSPATGLSTTQGWDPEVILQDDQTYILTGTTPAGCVAKDTVNITVFKGSSIYVPTAFTPDNNGLNDLLKPSYYGIKSLDFFKVYSRWGELVYSTKNMSAGWDAMINGTKQPTGVYVWMLRATDYAGKVYQLKGTSTIVR
jgi:gliding motility-associated-like protein